MSVRKSKQTYILFYHIDYQGISFLAVFFLLSDPSPLAPQRPPSAPITSPEALEDHFAFLFLHDILPPTPPACLGSRGTDTGCHYVMSPTIAKHLRTLMYSTYIYLRYTILCPIIYAHILSCSQKTTLQLTVAGTADQKREEPQRNRSLT